MLNSDGSGSTADEAGPVVLGGQPMTIDTVDTIARARRTVSVTEDARVLDRVRAAAQFIEEAVSGGQQIYGVTTGFGGEAGVPIPAALAAASQENLLSFLTAGAGDPLEPHHVRAAMVLRANMLLRGVSGVRLELIERLVRFLNADAIPVVGELGSIGASGDLIPMATIARAITGHRLAPRLLVGDRVVDARTFLAEQGLEPLTLRPKEGLGIVNGTTFSAAIAAGCVQASRHHLGLTFAVNAVMIRALCGFEEPFDAFVHDCKPHPGQIRSAAVMRRLLAMDPAAAVGAHPPRSHVQDRYSLRCLPQYYGAIVDDIERIGRVVETEMNAVTDNPLIDLDAGRFYQSGNFLGQYLGIAMDDLRRMLALMAKHLDVQIALLVTPEFNHGLPASLKGNPDNAVNMGLKGLQIAGNSIMPLLTFLGNPLVQHFPTHAEQFNQNINGLSWGAANLATRAVDLFGHYIAIALIFAMQAADMRAFASAGHFDGRAVLGARVRPLYEAVYETLGRAVDGRVPLVFNDADQSLESWIAALNADIRRSGRTVRAVAPIVAHLCGAMPESTADREGLTP